MKITDITATVLSSRYDRPIHFAHMELTERRIILVRVYTDEGLVGLADVDGPPAGDMACVQLIRDTFRPLLLGRNPLDIGARLKDMFYVLDKLGRYRSLESYVLGAIDTALWDILGKASNQPIHRLLGSRRDEISLYASLGQLPLGMIAEEVGKRAAEGFSGVKIRIGFQTEQDESIVAEARRVLKPTDSTRLMADANSGWNRAHAVQYGKRLEKHELHWLEEPLPPYDLTGYAHLAANLDTPVAMGEHEIFNRYDARDILLAGAADILQPDLRQGISEVVKIAHLASAWDIPCIPHFFGPALRFAAQVQVLASIDNYQLCEYPVAFDPIRFELTDPPLAAEKGKIAVPQGPGLGVTLNEATVKRYTVE
ncbi:mandelate racemase/muconate lactonizing enzyme family protein [Ferrovibrio xuzhouensis]|uniref:Mandelate racemase/muconate lactonizing enzyme family protein n=1 Tax=Ferrovibrio xuzhouensis TaxID=1576914 RepID=A0ABV7VNB0_9PROT